MKKSSFFIFIVSLFFISCSNGEEPLVPCVTVSDCPDSSYSCFDGFCVHAGSVVDPTDTDSGDPSGDTLPEGEVNDGGDTSDNGENGRDDETDSGLPDPVTEDDDDVLQDTDTVEENDDDVPAADDEKSDEDGIEGEDADSGNNGDNDTDTGNDTDADADDDVDNDADADNDTDTEVELPTELSACAAAIAALPHGGKYDWDDGTTQGFSTNTYWNLVESSVLPARSGSYSFGKYSQYTVNKDQISPLLTATDLSACKECMVKASFYVKGQICNGNCEAQTFLHPTCNGEGNTTVVDKTVSTWSQWTIPPESPWVDDDLDFFKAKANSNQYSAVAWKDLEWTIPDTCMTDEFVFALRFRSSSLVAGPGLVVDDLTIYTTTKNKPKGEFESAENGKITGWACDPDAYPEKVPVKVRYYKNKDESVVAAERSIDAEIERTGLTQCDGTYDHGFEIPLDAELAGILGIGTHSAAVFAGDLPAECAGTYELIGKKEFEITSLDPKK